MHDAMHNSCDCTSSCFVFPSVDATFATLVGIIGSLRWECDGGAQREYDGGSRRQSCHWEWTWVVEKVKTLTTNMMVLLAERLACGIQTVGTHYSISSTGEGGMLAPTFRFRLWQQGSCRVLAFDFAKARRGRVGCRLRMEEINKAGEFCQWEKGACWLRHFDFVDESKGGVECEKGKGKGESSTTQSAYLQGLETSITVRKEGLTADQMVDLEEQGSIIAELLDLEPVKNGKVESSFGNRAIRMPNVEATCDEKNVPEEQERSSLFIAIIKELSCSIYIFTWLYLLDVHSGDHLRNLASSLFCSPSQARVSKNAFNLYC
ncbi:hypothetical protein E2542_SST30734 [Spatholobus suberectus]|nr:hypothetical protein E2542_SST30734 [Spatholobus suberectus]